MPVYTAHQLICHVFHLRSNGIINNTSAFTSLCLIIRRKALMYSLWSPAATFVASATKAGKKEIRLHYMTGSLHLYLCHYCKYVTACSQA